MAPPSQTAQPTAQASMSLNPPTRMAADMQASPDPASKPLSAKDRLRGGGGNLLLDCIGGICCCCAVEEICCCCAIEECCTCCNYD